MEDFLNFLETGSLVRSESYFQFYLLLHYFTTFFYMTFSQQIQATSEGMNKPPPGVRKRTGGPETPPRRNPSTGDISTTSAGSASPGSGKLKQFPPVAPISLGTSILVTCLMAWHLSFSNFSVQMNHRCRRTTIESQQTRGSY